MNVRNIRLAGTGEKTLYLARDYNDITMRFILHYPGIVNADILRAAIRQVIKCEDSLHSSFLTNKIIAYWKINDLYDDSCFFHFIQTEEDPITVVRNLSLSPVLPESKAQIRCSLVQNNTESAVAVNISHLCVDGSDAKYLLCKIAEAYNRILKTGTAEDIIIKSGCRSAEQIYKGLRFKDILSLLHYPRPSITSSFPCSTEFPGAAHIVTARIPAHIMTAARNRAKSHGATANDLLLAACFHAYAALPAIEPSAPMRIVSMMDLRKYNTNASSMGLCNMSGTFSTILHDGIQENLQNTLPQVAMQTALVKNNPLLAMEGLPLLHCACRILPMDFLLSLAGKVYGNMSFGLTNFGSLPSKALKLGNLVPDYGFFGGPLKEKPAMQISALSIDEACSISVTGNYTAEDVILLQMMLDHMVLEITNYAGA